MRTSVTLEMRESDIFVKHRINKTENMAYKLELFYYIKILVWLAKFTIYKLTKEKHWNNKEKHWTISHTYEHTERLNK